MNTNNLNANWYVDQAQEDNWSWNLASSTPGNGSLRIRSTDFDDFNFRRLYSPIFDLSNVPAPCYMYYDYAYAIAFAYVHAYVVACTFAYAVAYDSVYDYAYAYAYS